ncbi:MAG: hypothetical protein OEP95_11185, partial [Myxococcales bacterium]|nr:hypothetical protein [Myxococcales bacterium]
IDEEIHSGPENLEVPADVLEFYHVEPGEDGAYVFIPREDAPPLVESEPRRRPRGTVQGTVAEVGPFSCTKDFTAPVGLNAPPTFSIVPGVTTHFRTDGGLRLTARGGATVSAVYKPRIQAAMQGKVGCKVKLLEQRINAPGVLALVIGAQVPIGVGFELSGTVTFAQFGFDASWSDSFLVEVGVDCTSDICVPVASAPEPAAPTSPTTPFTWVLPNVLSDFNLALEVKIFGYFEIEIGNPLWETLRLSMFEGQAGAALTGNFAPRITQLSNATSASSYKASLYAKVGTGVSLANALGFLNISLANFEVKTEIDVANSPTAAPNGSLTFDSPVTMGDEVVARVVLKDPTFFLIDNVQEVRIYRKDGTSTELKATVAGSDGISVGNGLGEYTGRWTATFFDPGAEFGVMVKTVVPFVEFEIEANSLRTLEEGDGEPGGVLFMGEGHVLDANVQGPDDSERDLYENGDLIIPPGPFHEQVMASLGSSSASAVHDTEVVLDSAGGLERIELAGSGATVESGDDSSTVFNIFSVGFTVVDPVPYSFTASTDLPDGQSQQVYVQLTRLSTVVACAEEAADDVPRACAGASGSEIATGTLIPGEYGFHARMVLGDDASATFSATLSLGN